ncbi:MAG: lipoyltransferase [Prevotella sp.]|jgi:lipoate---protein ligase|nr:lipoyltransferase [Prevotella sp.]MCI1280986.1 lipoyltransferase [Prevotella sp.]
MIYIALPDSKPRLLPFYLAMEEYIAHQNHDDDCFFMWQVQPTVIFGRNQLIENEVNLDYCKAHHIHTFRRKSGGGCVYADMSNIMFSYITKDENVNFTFNKYINMVALVLCKLGIEAKASGRNDILIDGKKVSGNAFYHIPGRSIVHGTMLYDTNMENMVGSITPTDEKLVSKGVKSVRQHIALLKDYIDLSLEDFKTFVRKNLCNKELMLTAEDIVGIEDIEQEYLTREFIYGNNPRYTLVHHHRIDNVGDFEIRIELKNNLIKEVNIMGDYFLTGDIDNRILKPLKNVPFEEQSIAAALPEKVDDIIMNLQKNELIKMILNS